MNIVEQKREMLSLLRSGTTVKVLGRQAALWGADRNHPLLQQPDVRPVSRGSGCRPDDLPP